MHTVSSHSLSLTLFSPLLSSLYLRLLSLSPECPPLRSGGNWQGGGVSSPTKSAASAAIATGKPSTRRMYSGKRMHALMYIAQ